MILNALLATTTAFLLARVLARQASKKIGHAFKSVLILFGLAWTALLDNGPAQLRMPPALIAGLGIIAGTWILMLFGTSLGTAGKKQAGISAKGFLLFALVASVCGTATFFMLSGIAGKSIAQSLGGAAIGVSIVCMGLMRFHKVPVILAVLSALALINGLPVFNPWFLGIFLLMAVFAFFITRKNLVHGKALTANGADFQFTIAIMLIVAAYLAGFHWSVAGIATGVILALGSRTASINAGRHTVLHELASDALAFFLGAAIPLATLTGQLPLIIGAIVITLAVSAGITALLAKTPALFIQRWFQALPVRSSVYALLFAGIGLGLLPEAFALGIILCGLLAGFAPKTPGSQRSAGAIDQHDILRPLVCIAKPDSASSLIRLASHLLRQHENATVRVVSVAGNGEPGTLSISDAENTLIHCVTEASSNELLILPSLVVAHSPAEGLAKAASDRESDIVILGWNNQAQSSDLKSLEMLPLFLQASRTLTVTVKNSDAFSRLRRLCIIVPPGVQDTPGFYAALCVLEALTGLVSGKKLLCFTLKGDSIGLADAGKGLLRKDSMAELANWKDLPEAIRQRKAVKSAFCIITGRPNSPGWNPSNERIANTLTDAFSDAALMVLYPSPDSGMSGGVTLKENTLEAEASAKNQGQWPQIIVQAAKAGRIISSMKEPALVDAIRTLTGRIFPDRKDTAGRLATEFSANARTAPLELEDGTILLHAHVEGLDHSTLAIGVRSEGWNLMALSHPVRTVLVLCSPSGANPQVHLDALTELAYAIRDKNLTARILDSEDILGTETDKS